MNIKRLFFFIFLSFWPLSEVSIANVIDRIVAKVNSGIITLSDLEKRVYIDAKVDGNTDEKELSKIFKRDKNRVLIKIVEEKLMLHYVKQLRMEPTKDDINTAIEDIKKRNNFSDDMFEIMLEREGLTYERYRKKLKDQIAMNRVLNSEVRGKIKINEKEVVSYFNKNKKKFLRPEEIKAYHIIFFVSDKTDRSESKKQLKKALYVLEMARRGDDFEELAKTHSDGPSKDAGGDLGWIARGAMIPAFEKAAFSLRKGEISNPVITEYGYHIIKVEDKKEETIKTLDEIRDEIRNTLFKQKYDKKYNSWMAELKRNSFIEIYLDRKPKILRRYYSLNRKQKVSNRSNNSKSKSTKIVHNKKVIKKKRMIKKNSNSISYKDKIKISKFILDWENVRETKNRRRYFSFYSEDFKINGLNRKEWEKITEKEYEKYKVVKIEIRAFRVFKRDKYYIATFDQRVKSNIDDQIRLVMLYLKKNKNGFKIFQEKWLNSPYTYEEFSKKPLLTFDTLPKTSSKLSKKKRRSRIIQPLGIF